MRVTTERRGRVLIARLDRPEKRNAMNGEMTRGLDAAMNQLEDDPELWGSERALKAPGCPATTRAFRRRGGSRWPRSSRRSA